MRHLRGAAVATLLSLIALVPAVLATPVARADGDPASDVLLGTDVFYPFTPVAHSVTVTLNGDVAALRREKLGVKVALIPTAVDLGTVTVLFGRPQSYADFLAQEISFVGKGPLLVVMPNGYGTNDMPPAAARAVKALPRPSSAAPTVLATAAIGAVRAYALAVGHPLPGGSAVPGTGSGGSHTIVIILLVAAAILGAAAVAAATLRRRGLAASEE